MSPFKQSLAVIVLVCGCCTLARAQGLSNTTPFPENGVLFVSTGGNSATRTVTEIEAAMLLGQGATPIAAGTFVLMHGGKFYTVADHKMPDGKMLSQQIMQRAGAGR